MKRTSCALLLILLTVLPIAALPLESLDTASLLFRIGFGINPFFADVQGLASAFWYFDRADGRKIDFFPEAAAGIYLTDE
jgi:hypothetical protein